MDNIEKIKDLMNYAMNNEHCDFYKNLYADKNIDSGNIKTMKDFERLPIITKKDINMHKQKHPFLFVDEMDIVACEFTSGTSNDILTIYKSAKDREIASEKRLFSIKNENLPPDSRILIVKSQIIALKKSETYKSLGYTVVNGDIYNLNLTAELAIAMNINVIRSSPTIALKLGRILKIRGYATGKIRLIALGNEIMSDITKKEIQNIFPSSRMLRHYATTESSRLGYQCHNIENTDKYHEYDDYHIYEIINPENALPCTRGETGELVITNLWTDSATPLIRYRTGDLAEYTEDLCKCGKKMFRVLGRIGFDRVRLGGITLFNENFEKAISSAASFVSDYQIHIFEKNKRGRIMPGIEVECVLRKGIKGSDMLKKNIEERIMSNFEIARDYTWKTAVEKNIFLPIEARFTNEIKRDELKPQKITDHRTDIK